MGKKWRRGASTRASFVASGVMCISMSLASSAWAQTWRGGGGYIGEAVTHPGLVGVVERSFPLSKKFEWFAAGDVGFYWHPRAEFPVFVDARGGIRWLTRGRYSADISGGLGYMHAFIAAETANFKNSGRPALMPVLDVTFLGLNLAPKTQPELRLASSVRILWQYPVNHHLVAHPALTLTLTRSFGGTK